MKHKIIIYICCAVTFIMAACDDFLDEAPSKSRGIQLTTVEQLEALLSNNNFSSGSTLDNNFTSILSSDSYEINTEYYNGGLEQMVSNPEILQLCCWEMPLTQNTNENVSMWNANFEAIYLANLILTTVDKVSGTDEQKKTIKYRAHLIRAYNYFDLACYYCMPYGKTTLNELGLPIKQSTSYDESMKRVSLEETYQFIENDILEAVKLNVPLFEGGIRKSWKETGATANSLAARFYLTKGEYTKAEGYATKALEFGNDLLDFNDKNEIDATETESYADMSMVPVSTWWEPGTDTPTFFCDKERAYYYKKNYYMYIGMWGIPSTKLLQLYNTDYDLRYKFFVVKNFQKIFFMGMYGRDFTMDVPGYSSFNGSFFTAPNVAEMRLIYAECLARNNNVTEAMSTLNQFRAYRLSKDAPSNIVNLAAANKDAAIKLILDERMREFPFTLRWNDIRRCNFNDDPNDDVTVTRNFYGVEAYSVNKSQIKTYTLNPSSRRYAVAIPNAEIVASQGVIEQNKY